MRVLVTGASGWIGSAVVPELLAAGHTVVGLARSDAAADRIAASGAEVRRGELDDLDSLRAAVADADGVVHLGYNHDFSDMAGAAATDHAAIEVFGTALAARGGPLLIATGTLGLTEGSVAVETDMPDPSSHPRSANSAFAFSFADRGARPVALRFAPTVHGEGDHGFVARLVQIAREQGVSGYVGDGTSRWPAVHVLDAGRLVARALDRAPAATAVHVTAEDGVPSRTIAEAIGRGLDVPVRSIPADDATEHFGWLGRFFAADAPASSAATRQLLGWEPTHPGLVADLDAGHYFRG